MKKLLALVLAVLMLVPAAALADTLILGSNCSFPPFEFIDDNGQPTGFDIEIGALIAEKMGKDLFVEDMSFDGLLMALDGKIDMCIAAMTITDARREQADFSDSYFNAQQKIIVRADYDGIQSLEDIKDKQVAVQEGTTGHILATEELALPAEKVASFKNAADAIMELLTGRADCVIIDTAPANVFVSVNGGKLVILEDIETPAEDYGIAVKKGNTELLNACNEVLAEIKANGVYDELVAKYFTTAE